MKSSKTTPTHELSEIITQPNMKFDVYEYMVIRKEFLNFLANVNGLLVEARKAFELLLAKQLEEANRFDERQNADGNFATFEERAWKHLLQIM